MNVTCKLFWIAAAIVATSISNESEAQTSPKLRPIGSPSAVDAFATQSSSRPQIARMQSGGDSFAMPPPSLPPPSLPPSGFTVPPTGTLPPQLQSAPGGFNAGPIPPPRTTTPQPVQPSPAGPPRTQVPPAQGQGLPNNPNLSTNPAFTPRSNVGPGSSRQTIQSIPGIGGNSPRPSSGPSDYAAIPQPQLSNAFATMDNCRNISGPSTYRASGAFGCGAPNSYASPVYAPVAFVPPPSQIAPAVALPPGATFNPGGIAGTVPPVIPGSSGYRPLFTLGQESKPVQVGQGIIGQPVAYVPGQFFRNALRYISF